MFAFTNTQHTTTLKLDAPDGYVFNAWNNLFGERNPKLFYLDHMWRASFIRYLSRELGELVMPGYVLKCNYNRKRCHLIKQDSGEVVVEVDLSNNYATLSSGFTTDDFRKLVERMLEALCSTALAAINLFNDKNKTHEREMYEKSLDFLNTLTKLYLVTPMIDEQLYKLAEEVMSHPNGLEYVVKLKPGQAERWRQSARRSKKIVFNAKSRQITVHYPNYGTSTIKVTTTVRFRRTSAYVTISLVDRGKTHTANAVVWIINPWANEEWEIATYFTSQSISRSRESFELFKAFKYRVLDLLRDGLRALRDRLAASADASKHELEYIDAWLDILKNPAQLVEERFWA